LYLADSSEDETPTDAAWHFHIGTQLLDMNKLTYSEFKKLGIKISVPKNISEGWNNPELRAKFRQAILDKMMGDLDPDCKRVAHLLQDLP
jgi:hypothetical protein